MTFIHREPGCGCGWGGQDGTSIVEIGVTRADSCRPALPLALPRAHASLEAL